MKQSSEVKARPKNGRVLAIAAAVLCATALSQPNLAYAGPHGGGGGGVSTAADLVDFTVASPLCTKVSASVTRVSAIGAVSLAA